MYRLIRYIAAVAAFGSLFSLGSCSKSESYSDMLRDEEHAVNWFLAGERVELKVPDDGNFITGEDAPYYKIEEEGNVYMQVVSKGKPDTEWEKGDKVYFRFMRRDISDMYNGIPVVPSGNADDLDSDATYFIFGNTTLSSSTQYGEGIQLPLYYLGQDCEVNLVVKSYQGFTIDQSNCVPYLYNIRYFKALY